MSHNSCNSHHSYRYSSANQKIVLSEDLVPLLAHSKTVWIFRQAVFVFIAALVFCVAMLISKMSWGQTTAEASRPAATSRAASLPTCDIKPAAQKTDPTSSETKPKKDQLQLSLPGTPGKSPLPEGAFCRRLDQDSQNLSTAPPTQNEAPQRPPIAQNIGGQLMIHANGQDFASVLRAVGTASGIDIEMPAENMADPVFMNVGPVSAKEAVIALMDGTRYNYVIMGSRSDPGIVTRLILSERSSVSTGAPLVAAVSEAALDSQPTLYGGQGVQEDPDAMNATPSAQGATIVPAVAPSSVPTGINVDKLAAQSNKTRGEILDELQKQQLQVLDNQSSAQPQQ